MNTDTLEIRSLTEALPLRADEIELPPEKLAYLEEMNRAERRAWLRTQGKKGSQIGK